jgi:hypothetical protein
METAWPRAAAGGLLGLKEMRPDLAPRRPADPQPCDRAVPVTEMRILRVQVSNRRPFSALFLTYPPLALAPCWLVACVSMLTRVLACARLSMHAMADTARIATIEAGADKKRVFR